MQAIDLFGLLVAAVGAVHLCSRVAARLMGAYGVSRENNKRSPFARSDWYVFFRCSSLYGKQGAGRDGEGAAGQLNRQHHSASRAGSVRSRPRATLVH
ncbi:MAG: hypothetical protein IH612_15265 [Desulfofustis sp.]|nr:hypothetical protein [Desulfofustis sp.]